MKKELIIALAATMAACCGKKDAAQGTSSSDTGTGASSPHTLVYRTSTDHADHVPVLLSDDKTRIISYPHPNDLKTGNGYPVPTSLGKGYLLDNRGIGLNVAYLSMTYAQYAALDQAPSLETLEASIIDRDPLVEMCECARRNEFKDPAKEIAAWVEAGELQKHCKKLK
jgi:hypothetical protein